MAERHPVSNDLFWTLAVWIGALLCGVIFAVVIGRIAGAGLGAGIFFGAIVFVLTGWFVASFTSASNLPPPNTLTAPTVLRSPTSRSRDVETAAPLPETVGGKVAKASYHTGEAVRALGAAVGQAAADLGGVVGKVAAEVGGTVARKADEARDDVRTVLAAPEAAPVDLQPVETRSEPDLVVSRPAGLAAAREGGADDLKRIKGVGPKLEELLHSLGFHHFDQIAAWTAAELAWVDSHLEGFNGRATRDDWVGQSRILAAGGETEHSQRVDRGEST